jgi:hypothetical protein
MSHQEKAGTESWKSVFTGKLELKQLFFLIKNWRFALLTGFMPLPDRIPQGNRYFGFLQRGTLLGVILFPGLGDIDNSIRPGGVDNPGNRTNQNNSQKILAHIFHKVSCFITSFSDDACLTAFFLCRIFLTIVQTIKATTTIPAPTNPVYAPTATSAPIQKKQAKKNKQPLLTAASRAAFS